MLSLSQLKYLKECEDESVFIENLEDLDIEKEIGCDLEDMEE